MSPRFGVKDAYVSSDSTFESLEGPLSWRVREEMFDLRGQLSQLQGRLDEAEDGRRFHAAMADELKQALLAFKQDTAHDELVIKSLRLAELYMEMDAKQDRIKALEAEAATLQDTLLSEQEKTKQLAIFVHSIHPSDDNNHGDNILRSLTSYVAGVEEERRSMVAKCGAQENTILKLQADILSKDNRIKALEELNRSLNQKNNDEATTLTDDAKQGSESREEPASSEVPREVKRRQLSLRDMFRSRPSQCYEPPTTPIKADEEKEAPESPPTLTASSSPNSSSDDDDDGNDVAPGSRSLSLLSLGGPLRRERPKHPSSRSKCSEPSTTSTEADEKMKTPESPPTLTASSSPNSSSDDDDDGNDVAPGSRSLSLLSLGGPLRRERPKHPSSRSKCSEPSTTSTEADEKMKTPESPPTLTASSSPTYSDDDVAPGSRSLSLLSLGGRLRLEHTDALSSRSTCSETPTTPTEADKNMEAPESPPTLTASTSPTSSSDEDEDNDVAPGSRSLSLLSLASRFRRELPDALSSRSTCSETPTTPTEADKNMEAPESPPTLTASSSPTSSSDEDEENDVAPGSRSLSLLSLASRFRRERPDALSSRSKSTSIVQENVSLSSSYVRKEAIKVKIAGQVGMYTGPVSGSKPNGVGTIRFSNGDTYLGALRDGKLHGTGTLYTKEGFFRGLFQDDAFMG